MTHEDLTNGRGRVLSWRVADHARPKPNSVLTRPGSSHSHQNLGTAVVSAVEVSHDLFLSGLCKSASCIQYPYYQEYTPILPLHYVAGTKQAEGLGSICFRVKISSDPSAASSLDDGPRLIGDGLVLASSA